MKKEVVYSNFDKYNGEFLKDFRHGIGDYTFNNGDKLSCEWEHNRVDGNVVFTSTSGLIYKSKWHNGQPIGNPKIFNNKNENAEVINDIEARLRQIGKYRLSFSQINKVKEYKVSNDENLKLYFSKLNDKKYREQNYERFYLGNYFLKFFKYIFQQENKFLTLLFLPITAIFVFTAPIFLQMWFLPFMLVFAIVGIMRAITGQQFFSTSKSNNDEKSLFNDNLIVILILIWTIFIGFIFFEPLFINIFETFF